MILVLPVLRNIALLDDAVVDDDDDDELGEGNSASNEDVTIRYLNCSSKAVSSTSGSDELIQAYPEEEEYSSFEFFFKVR